MARKPSHQDLQCLPICFSLRPKPLFASVDMSKFKDERVHFRNSGMRELVLKGNLCRFISFINGNISRDSILALICFNF